MSKRAPDTVFQLMSIPGARSLHLEAVPTRCKSVGQMRCQVSYLQSLCLKQWEALNSMQAAICG